jgi:hypothetical protein
MEISNHIVHQQINDCAKTFKMFYNQARSEIAIANNIIAETFEPYLMQIEQFIIKNNYILCPDIILVVPDDENDIVVSIGLSWISMNDPDDEVNVTLTKSQITKLNKISNNFAHDIGFNVEVIY